jgi:hypothetical protein
MIETLWQILETNYARLGEFAHADIVEPAKKRVRR